MEFSQWSMGTQCIVKGISKPFHYEARVFHYIPWHSIYLDDGKQTKL